MGVEYNIESYLLKCPNCEELSLDGFTGKCNKCGNIQPLNEELLKDKIIKDKIIKIVEETMQKEYIGKINLILNKKNTFLEVYFIKEKSYIDNSGAIIQLKVGKSDYKFYFNYNIKKEYTGDYNEEGISCVSGVNFSKIERLENKSWKKYTIKNRLNEKKIKQIIVMEILNNPKYNEHLKTI